MMSNQNVVRAAYYLRISTETQELDNQRGEILPFIERRGSELLLPGGNWGGGPRKENETKLAVF